MKHLEPQWIQDTLNYILRILNYILRILNYILRILNYILRILKLHFAKKEYVNKIQVVE